MKTGLRFVAVAVGAAALAGCTTLTEGEFKNTQAVVSGSPSAKRETIDECVARKRAEPLSERQEAASFHNVKLSAFPETYCKRLWNAVASGRITYDDYRKLDQPGADNSKIIRIMQGR